ncbi:MAG TPA: hypothetical protein VEV44_09415 [Pseudoneobacillus sp.]|nr:hypothetical protein [Pseudoneobacillus sp.]
MTNNKKNTVKLSFESDGKMGEKSKSKQKKGKDVEFFNTTPSSE